MSEWRMRTPDEARTLARTLEAAGSLLRRATPEAAAEALGWTIVDTIEDLAILVDTGSGLTGKSDGGFDLTYGLMTSIFVSLTDTVPEASPDGSAFLRNAFALATESLRELWGPPRFRLPERRPSANWEVDNDMEIDLSLGVDAVRLAVWLEPELVYGPYDDSCARYDDDIEAGEEES